MATQQNVAALLRDGDDDGRHVKRLAQVNTNPRLPLALGFPIDHGCRRPVRHIKPPADILIESGAVVTAELRALARVTLHRVVQPSDARGVGLAVLHARVSLWPRRFVGDVVVLVNAVEHGKGGVVLGFTRQHGASARAQRFVMAFGVAARRRDDHAERFFALHSGRNQFVEHAPAVLGGFVGDPQRRVQAVKRRLTRRQCVELAVLIRPRHVRHLDLHARIIEPPRHRACRVYEDLRLLHLVREHVHSLAGAAHEVIEPERRHERRLAVATGDLNDAHGKPSAALRGAPADQVRHDERLPRVQFERLTIGFTHQRELADELERVRNAVPLEHDVCALEVTVEARARGVDPLAGWDSAAYNVGGVLTDGCFGVGHRLNNHAVF